MNLEYAPRDPNIVTKLFGQGIADGSWTAEHAVGQLAETLTAVRCEPQTIQNGFIMLESSVNKSTMSPANPLFPSVVALATRGIILRNNDNDEPPQLPERVDIPQLVMNSTEGVLWESESGRQYRQRVTSEISGLLKSLINGLNLGGVPKRYARHLVRTEIETGMDDAATRIPSYSAIHFLLVSSSILDQADLKNFPAKYRGVKRYAKGFLTR